MRQERGERVKCSCGNPECINKINIQTPGGSVEIWIEHEKAKGVDLLIYADADGLLDLIKQAKKALIEMAIADVEKKIGDYEVSA